MIQIFFLGSSSIYGVGGEKGGYADIVKQTLHERMYQENGEGEKYEVFNFGKSGATTDFVKDLFPTLIDSYGRHGKIIVVLNVGGNNAKAENEPDNFVSTIEEYSAEMSSLLDSLKDKCTHVIGIGGGYFDESKTNPKSNPLTGGRSYFSNKRSGKFKKKFMQLCEERNLPFLNVEITESEWYEKYMYEDGLHANTAGHELFAKKIMEVIDTLL